MNLTSPSEPPDNHISEEEKSADQAMQGRALVPPTGNNPTVLIDKDLEELARGKRFPALQYPNFRLFWIGNFISVIGTMVQQTGQGWLIRELSADPRTVTAVTACATLPILLFSLLGGVVADRVDKRRALVIINIIAGGFALLLGVLVWTRLVQVWEVMAIAFAVGTCVAFEIPIRQTFYVELVGKETLSNAISLNSSAFNLARVIGPALAGVLITGIGLDGCFLVNSISFIFVIIGLGMMSLQTFHPMHNPMRLVWLWRAIKYVLNHSSILGICILISFVSFSAISYGALLPIFAKDVFHSGVKTYALFQTYNAVGALLASVLLAAQRTMRHKGKRLFLGALIYSLSVLGFSLSPNIEIACAMLVISGMSGLTMLITANTLVQLLSPDHLRGRIFSVYSMAFLGITPFGAILQGVVANSLGPRVSVAAGAVMAGLFSIFIFVRFRGLWKES